VLLIGSLTILIVGLIKLGGWGELEMICAEKMHVIRPATDLVFPWPGVFLGVLIIGFWYFCTDQYIVQRVLSARNQKQGRRGAIFAGYLKLTPVFIFLVPGMIAFALNQKGIINLGISAEGKLNSDAAFPMLVRELLPGGMKGLVVGGLIAALMSSLASLFNSSAILFTVDFYKKYRPHVSEKHLVFVGRAATTAIVILGVLWIPVMKGLGKVLYMYLQDMQSLLAPGIAAAFFMGVFFKRTNAAGGLSGLIFGFTAGLFRLILNLFKNNLTEGSLLARIQSINWLYFCAILFLLCVTVTFIVSLLTQRPREEQLRGLTYGSASPEQIAETRQSWNGWDVFHTIVILGVILIFFWYFR
jgi:SSS family solute:Na+ symporter